MPVVSVGRDKLFERLGRSYTEDEFQELCFDYGIELDDVTTEQEMLRKEHHKEGDEAIPDTSEEVIYKIDIPANRYDMLCLEGIARALNIFRGTIPNIEYKLADMTGKPMVQLIVKPETVLVRPFVVAAVLRGVTLDATRYASFIDLQDKLHQNLCRQRSLVAIGTHDLTTVQGPFTYEALQPELIEFVPLKQTEKFTARKLLQHYEEHDQKLKKFVPLIKDSIVYPVIYDAKRTVLSLPPIINGAHSAITLATRDVLIECTATDLTKARIVLATVATMFSEYCTVPYEVEPVQVIDASGTSHVYPDLSTQQMRVTTSEINETLGVDLSADEMATRLSKMALAAEAVDGGAAVHVTVPPTRSDVLHAVDVIEDVAIAYGYNNISKRLPTDTTPGQEQPLNQLGELLRLECAMAGYYEVLTWALCSRADNFTNLRRPDDGASAVSIGNPATAEFEVCRTTLLTGVLKTLGANKDAPLPIKLFEISDVVLLSNSSGVGAVNERRLVVAHCGKESGLENVIGVLNRIMEVLAVPWEGDSDIVLEAKYGGNYSWKGASDSTFFPGRQADVYAKGVKVGQFGIVHPDVLANFGIQYPVAALELNIEPFCFDQFYKPLQTHYSLT